MLRHSDLWLSYFDEISCIRHTKHQGIGNIGDEQILIEKDANRIIVISGNVEEMEVGVWREERKQT